MNTRGSKAKGIVFILVTILIVTFGTQNTSYAQEVNPTITVSVEAPLTEATLHGSVVTLTLSGGRFIDWEWYIREAVSISGIDGVTIKQWDVERVSDTEVAVPLEFAGNIDTDATLTFTVGPVAIADYNGNALTATLPVTAIQESLEASTEAPLTEANLDGSIITLTLSGRQFVDEWDIGDTMSFSGIEGVIVGRWDVERVSDTVATVSLRFSGNIDTDTTLTLTVGPDAIVGGYDKDFTFEFPVTAVQESLDASTEAPLTEANLDGSVITLTLTGRRFADDSWYIADAVSFSGIDSVIVRGWNVARVSDTEATLELTFSGNIDENTPLTLTVGPDAIVGGYDKDFTFQFPVTAVEESLVISTEFPLTEANLDGSIITLTLTGRRLADSYQNIRDALSVSGIDGVNIHRYGSFPLSDTELRIRLTFSGNMDTDATLTLTIGASAIAGYNQGATKQFPVTAIQKSNATMSISPASVVSPAVGEQLTLNLNITGGENVAGYQATVLYDPTALYPVDITNGDYLPENPFFLADRHLREVRLTAGTLAEAANGDGTLTTLTFEVEDFKASTLTLSKVYLVDADGKRWEVTTVDAEVTIPPEPAEAIFGDINRDGVVNIQDLIIVNARFGQRGKNSADLNVDGVVNIVDLVLVAGVFNDDAAAPASNPQALQRITTADVQGWLFQAGQLALTEPAYLRGMTALEQLLKALAPKKTALLPNYPNPFNPETWIPYHLSDDANVQIEIYNTKGVLVRRLDLGHQMAGYYTDRTKAAYWDGKNAIGEQVASGVYFYHLSAGDYSATRKMLILK